MTQLKISHFFFSILLLFLASAMPKTRSLQFSKSHQNLGKAYILGDKKGLKRKIKKAHQKLHLLHLMTPSGLHLTAALLLLKKLKINKILLKIVLILVIILTTYFNDYFALRRMAIFGLSKNFFLSFLLDFILGGWHQSPYSFALSFIFIGIILINKNSSGKILARDLLISQSLIAISFHQLIYPLGFIMGFFLTSFFSLIFPLFTLDLIFTEIKPLSYLFSNTLIFLSSLTSSGFSPYLILFLIPLFQIKYFSLFFLFIFPTKIQDFPHSLYGKKAFPAPPPKNYSSIKQTYTGVTLSYPNGMKCRRKLYSTGWSTRCRF